MLMTIISELMTIISRFDRELVRLDEFSWAILAFLGRFRHVWASSGSVPQKFVTPLAPLDAYLSYEYVRL